MNTLNERATLSQRLHVIYVPGLGDAMPAAQRKVVGLWRWWGVEPELFQMNWADNVPWQTKFEKLLGRIDALTAEGKQVALVGASAGASAVINAYAARKKQISGVVCLCGKINHPEAIGPAYRSRNPSFVESAEAAPNSLSKLSSIDRTKIQSRYSILDGVVRRRDSVVPGAQNRTILTVGHSITIALQLIFGAPFFLRFLKRRT